MSLDNQLDNCFFCLVRSHWFCTNNRQVQDLIRNPKRRKMCYTVTVRTITILTTPASISVLCLFLVAPSLIRSFSIISSIMDYLYAKVNNIINKTSPQISSLPLSKTLIVQATSFFQFGINFLIHQRDQFPQIYLVSQLLLPLLYSIYDCYLRLSISICTRICH